MSNLGATDFVGASVTTTFAADKTFLYTSGTLSCALATTTAAKTITQFK
jgi:hypothetical protein